MVKYGTAVLTRESYGTRVLREGGCPFGRLPFFI
nr:MAG TPA: hypothetical protein [Caudoviricetes sp.]